MEQKKLHAYKTKFRVLFLIAAIVMALFVINIFKLFQNNGDLANTSHGLLLIIYFAILIVLFIMVLLNVFAQTRKVHTVINENIKLKEEQLQLTSAQKKQATDKNEVEAAEDDSKMNVLDEVWEEVKKEKDADKITETFLIQLSKKIEIVQGLFYLFDKKEKKFKVAAKYAYYNEEEPVSFDFGEGLSGQVAKDMKPMYISDLPEKYMTVASGLGSAAPSHLLILPVINKKKVIGIVELASYMELEIVPEVFLEFLKGVSDHFVKDKKK